jgi:rubrerythrin
MALQFTGSELVEIAVQMEKNGMQFYAAAADAVGNARARGLLRDLAADEVQHLRIFQGLLTNLALADLNESYPGEYQVYLQAHVDGQVFTEARMKRLLAQQSLSEREALQFGLDSEKDAILYYTEMLRFVPGADQKTVQGIIEEEKKHLAKLAAMMKELAT